MAWSRHGADQQAINDVNIVVFHGSSAVPFSNNNIQFPPSITNDSKSASYDSKPILAYEPLKIYKGAEPRSLGLKFEWITGGNFPPSLIKDAINIWKNCLYFGDAREPLIRSPVIKINKLYKVIEGGATFRLLNVKIDYSPEKIKIGSDWWAVHTVLNVDMELMHNIAGYGTGAKPAIEDSRVNNAPQASWL